MRRPINENVDHAQEERPESRSEPRRLRFRGRGARADVWPKAGNPFTLAIEPFMMIDPPSTTSGNAFWTVKSVPRTFRPKVLSKCSSVTQVF
jgi:hypothetical protein